jgi:glyoxylate reductase
MQPKVLVTRKIPDHVLKILEETCELKIWPHEDIPVTREFLEREITDVNGLYCLLTDTIDEELLSRATKLKAISTMAVGYNHIDVSAATVRGIPISNTPNVLTETTADLAFALMLATSRRIIEASELLRRDEWKTWSPMLLTGQDVHGATLGIIGMGRIGEAVARRASGFDMKILYHNRSRKLEVEQKYGLEYTDLNQLLSRSDFVMILVPFHSETANLIAMEQLRMMKHTAVLINVARGGIVNETDLYEALKSGMIWAAGLDVFNVEPVSMDHPLLTLPNVVALPHIGSASIKTRFHMAQLAAENLLQGLAGERPKCLVNPEVFENARM